MDQVLTTHRHTRDIIIKVWLHTANLLVSRENENKVIRVTLRKLINNQDTQLYDFNQVNYFIECVYGPWKAAGTGDYFILLE